MKSSTTPPYASSSSPLCIHPIISVEKEDNETSLIKWHPILYIGLWSNVVQYGPLSKVVHYIKNRVTFGTNTNMIE
jgi:hypothetical protein